MAFPVTIPNTFSNATSSIPLSQLDNNFTTLVTALNGVANGAESLANVTITGGNISNVTLDNVTVDVETLSNVTITNLTVDGTANLTNSTVTANLATITTANVTTLNVSGNTTLGDASGDSVTINAATVSTPNGLNFDSDTFVIDATNNRVGIGTASPAEELDVNISQNGPTRIQVKNTNTGTGVQANLYIANSDTGNYYLSAGLLGTSFTSTGLFFQNSGQVFTGSQIDGLYIHTQKASPLVFGTAGLERLRIDSSGNVGIGTSSPGAKLHVVGSSLFAASAGASLMTVGSTGVSGNHRINILGGGAGQYCGYYINSAPAILSNTSSSSVLQLGSDGVSTTFQTQAFYTNGTERMRIDSSGNVGIGTSSPVRQLHINNSTAGQPATFQMSTANTGGTTGDGFTVSIDGSSSAVNLIQREAAAMQFYTSDTERMRITAAGEVLVGGTTVVDTTSWIGGTPVHLNVQSTGGGYITLYRNDTSVSSGNLFGGVGFYGNDTTSNTPTLHAYIQAAASGTHSAGDNPTDLVFATTPTGSATVAEKMRLTEAGYLRMASGTGGIQFNGDTASANALDDYEEGSWTPTLPNNGTVTYTGQFGRYTKIGNLVTVTFSIAISNYTGGSSVLVVGGLPFTTGIEGNFAYGAVLALATGLNLSSGYTWATLIPTSTGGSVLGIYENGDNITNQQLSYNNLGTSAAIMGTVTYKN